jgi:hypothetical protein
VHEEINHFRFRPINTNDHEGVTSDVDEHFIHDQPMENHNRVVIVDSTSPTTKLEIDTTRLEEKKRKHRRKLSFIYRRINRFLL